MLKHIVLENFRNHKKFCADLNNTSILIGLNATGKTSVLEAISLVSAGRSFRTDDKKSVVNLASDYARVTLWCHPHEDGDPLIVDSRLRHAERGLRGNGRTELEVFIQKNPRLLMQAKERGVKKKLSEFIGTLKSVVFSPETIDIITGAPAERRRFLDIMISQSDKGYLRALSEYTKVRRQRNGLLEMIKHGRSQESDLLFWDKELAKQGIIITQKRIEAVEFLNMTLSKTYQEISGPIRHSRPDRESTDRSGKLLVDPRLRGDDKKDRTKDQSLVLIYHNSSGDDLAEKLRHNRAREIAYGATIYGPHRDELEFGLNNTNMQEFASRGELRSAILALKIGEIKFLGQEANKTSSLEQKPASPILLLDDIFSEFDAERRSHLNRLILQYQSVITTTDKEHLTEEIFKKAKIIEL